MDSRRKLRISLVTAGVAVVALCLVLAFFIPSAAASGATQFSSKDKKVDLATLQPVGTPTTVQKKAVFNRVWTLFKDNYPDFKEKVVNWDRTRTIYEPRALKASTWPKFFQTVSNMIGTLHDVHCRLINAPLPTRYFPALSLTSKANQVFVVAAPNSKKVRPGMIVLGVNGKPITDQLQASNADWFRPVDGQLEPLFITNSDKPISVTVENAKTNAIQTVKMPVYSMQQRNSYYKTLLKQHPAYKVLNSSTKVSVLSLGSGILYMRIPSMTNDLQQQIQPYMNQISHAKGLIIDVRNNGGGNSAPASLFASHFYTKTKTALEVRYRFDGGLSPWYPEPLKPRQPHIGVPTALLINGNDVSSAEMFIAQMQVAKNVRTFGSRTFGGDGNLKKYSVMQGVSVGISSWQQKVIATGQPIEEVGIEPEQPVPWSKPEMESYVHALQTQPTPYSADPVLQAGEKWVKSQLG